MAYRRIDRAKIKSEYLSNQGISLKSLSEKFGISESRLLQLSQKEGWYKEKLRIWDKAEKDVIEEVEGSVKDLLTRHSKSARYLQIRFLKMARDILDDLDDASTLSTKDKLQLLPAVIRGIEAAWASERELYPRQLEIAGKLEKSLKLEEIPKEVSDAFIEAFERGISGKTDKDNVNPPSN